MANDEEEHYIPGLSAVKKILSIPGLDHKKANLCTKWVMEYSNSIPDMDSLRCIAHYAKGKLILDIYSRNGYWASILRRMGINVLASDVNPAQKCHMPVQEIRSDRLLENRFDDAILLYGFPCYVDHDNDPCGIGYFPELKVWKGSKIIAIVDMSPCPYFKLTKNVSWSTTGDVFKAANLLTGSKWKIISSTPLKYKFHHDEKQKLEIYERITT